MVILQFNKLIRNKWVWGAFAIAISLFFCLDESIIRGGDSQKKSGAGKLGGEEIDSDYFTSVAEDVRGFGMNRDTDSSFTKVNRQTWEMIASLDVAEKNGLIATDEEVAQIIRSDRNFQANGGFSFKLYKSTLASIGLTPERFEEYFKRRATLMRLLSTVSDVASWASPAELEQAVEDMTDSITVRIARFTQDKKSADAVKLDDAALKKWYDENVSSLALPDRIKVRYIRFDATSPELLARMVVSEDEMHDRYDVMIDKYTTTDTNGVEKVKAFDEVKGEIEKELRQIAAIEYFETNLLHRVYSSPAKKGTSMIDEIAKADSLKVVTSDYFSLTGGWKEGFVKHLSQVLPGAKNAAEVIAELDPQIEDLRYGIVSSEKVVWLVERAELSPAHTPSFEEAKDKIKNRALRDAKKNAFKASVEAIAAKGLKAVLESGNVSTNITFSVSDVQPGTFDDQNVVMQNAIKLSKDGISPFVSTGLNRGLLVVCVDRVRGDAAKAMMLRSQIASDVQMLQRRQVSDNWQKSTLEKIGFEPVPATMTVDEASTETEIAE